MLEEGVSEPHKFECSRVFGGLVMKSVYVIIPLIVLMSGCSKTPDCGSTETSNIINNIYRDHEKLGAELIAEATNPVCNADHDECYFKLYDQLTRDIHSSLITKLSDVILLSKDSSTGTVHCKANFEW